MPDQFPRLFDPLSFSRPASVSAKNISPVAKPSGPDLTAPTVMFPASISSCAHGRSGVVTIALPAGDFYFVRPVHSDVRVFVERFNFIIRRVVVWHRTSAPNPDHPANHAIQSCKPLHFNQSAQRLSGF